MSTTPTGVLTTEVQTKTVTMDSDLSAKAGYAVNLDATDNENVDLASGASAFPYILLEGADGSSDKATGSIVRSGVAKVKLGGTVAPGDKLTSDGSGLWIKTVTDHNHYGAVAEAIGVSGDFINASAERGTVSA